MKYLIILNLFLLSGLTQAQSDLVIAFSDGAYYDTQDDSDQNGKLTPATMSCSEINAEIYSLNALIEHETSTADSYLEATRNENWLLQKISDEQYLKSVAAVTFTGASAIRYRQYMKTDLLSFRPTLRPSLLVGAIAAAASTGVIVGSEYIECQLSNCDFVIDREAEEKLTYSKAVYLYENDPSFQKMKQYGYQLQRPTKLLTSLIDNDVSEVTTRYENNETLFGKFSPSLKSYYIAETRLAGTRAKLRVLKEDYRDQCQNQ